MANSYTQLYIHCVRVVKGRENLIDPQHNEELHQYISGIVKNHKSKVYAINNMPDHFHMLISLHPSISLSDMMKKIKGGSSKFINEQGGYGRKFARQAGYGAFSHAQSQVSAVCQYIDNQQEHHKEHDFKSEYTQLLQNFDIDFDEDHVFEWYD